MDFFKSLIMIIKFLEKRNFSERLKNKNITSPISSLQTPNSNLK